MIVHEFITPKKLTSTAQCQLPTEFGVFTCQVFKNEYGVEHIALYQGKLDDSVLCRIHSECITSEVFGSVKCDCKAQLSLALKTIAQEKSGVLIYLRQEGRGIGLSSKIQAYALQEQGFNTIDANIQLHLPVDARSYDEAVDILKTLNVKQVRLMTNNPKKIQGLKRGGIDVIERLSHFCDMSEQAKEYVACKVNYLGHLKSH